MTDIDTTPSHSHHSTSNLANHKSLPRRIGTTIEAAVRLLNDAFDQRGDQRIPIWPKQLRVKSVEGAKGIWEMTWSWPDGRTTFEYADLRNEGLAILWRRIGGREVLRDP